MVYGGYDTTANNGYGGVDGKFAPGCRTGFTPVGKTCMILPEKAEQTFNDATLECAGIDAATLYGPTDDTQNAIMRSLMQHYVISYPTRFLTKG